MNILFREFARDVLNMETKALPMPILPTPFSAFLEEENHASADDLNRLKSKRTRLDATIRQLQKELDATNKKIAKKE